MFVLCVLDANGPEEASLITSVWTLTGASLSSFGPAPALQAPLMPLEGAGLVLFSVLAESVGSISKSLMVKPSRGFLFVCVQIART